MRSSFPSPEAPLRIAMVSEDYYPNPGGIATAVHALSDTIASLGHEVHLYAGHRRSNQRSHAPALQHAQLKQNLPFRGSSPERLWHQVRTLLALRAEHGSNPYDVFHWHNLIWESAATRMLPRDATRIFSNHSSGFHRRSQSRLRRKFQLPFLIGHADWVLCPSTLRSRETIAVGFPAERTSTVHNAVDHDTIAQVLAEQPRENLSRLRGASPIVFLPGRVEYVKGVDIALRAFADVLQDHPKGMLVLLSGSMSATIQREAQRMGIGSRVHFWGVASKEEMVELYRLSDVAVLPSRTEGGLPLSSLESLASGCPLVAARVGGLNDLPRELRAVRLVPPEDSRAVSHAIRQVLATSEKERRANMTRARDFVAANYTWERAARLTLSAYRSAMLHKTDHMVP